MIQLPNGCKCSDLKVNPKNWNTPKASIKKNWFIYYRFYDPSQLDEFPKGKLRVIKGMNDFKILSERQTIVQALIDLEIQQLKTCGYNPVLKKHVTPSEQGQIISDQTTFLEALQFVYSKANYTKRTLSDISSVLSYFKKAALQLQRIPTANYTLI
jgi:hypothetical protein